MPPHISDDESSDPVSEVELDDDLDGSELDEELDAMVGGNDDEEDDDDELVSEEEDNYRLEDPDEIDEDLELKDDDGDAYEEETRTSSRIARTQPKSKRIAEQASKTAATTTRHPRREVKRNMNYFDGLEESDFESTPDVESQTDDQEAPSKKRKKGSSSSTTVREDVTRPEELDPDLILTDEEQEYNPTNHARMTERQRKLESGTGFFELGQKKQKKEVKETEEEMALRKAESARRRLDYKNKQLEEEKRDTLNKLLKRRANKTREVQTDQTEPIKTLKPRRPIKTHPALVHYVSKFEGSAPIQTLSFNPEP